MKPIRQGLWVLTQAYIFTVRHVPISATAIIGVYFGIALFINPARDTMSITNYAFAIVIALSSVSFGYARCLDDIEDKKTIEYCGERFLHSAILFLVASIVKYFLLQDDIQAMNEGVAGVFISFVRIFPGALFLLSLINCIAALRELNTVLYQKKKPGQELAKFI